MLMRSTRWHLCQSQCHATLERHCVCTCCERVVDWVGGLDGNWYRPSAARSVRHEWETNARARIGAIPVSGEIQQWLQFLVVRLNWIISLVNETSQRMTLSPEYRWTTLLNKKGLLFVISSFTHRYFHSNWYFIVPLRDTRSNTTHEQGV